MKKEDQIKKEKARIALEKGREFIKALEEAFQRNPTDAEIMNIAVQTIVLLRL